jgi:HSP20 family protein
MSRFLIPGSSRFPESMREFQRELDSLMRDFFRAGEEMEPISGFCPRVNLAETANQYDVAVDLPGVKPEEMNVELKQGELWLTGQRSQEEEKNGKTYHRVERRYGRFQRVIPLPLPVKEGEIHAEYKDGVLRITVPKAEQARPKRIEVKV